MKKVWGDILKMIPVQIGERVLLIHILTGQESNDFFGLNFKVDSNEVQLDRTTPVMTTSECRDWIKKSKVEEVVLYFSGSKVLSKVDVSENAELDSVFPGIDPKSFMIHFDREAPPVLDLINKSFVEEIAEDLISDNNLLIGCEFGNSTRGMELSLTESQPSETSRAEISYRDHQMPQERLLAIGALHKTLSQINSPNTLGRVDRDKPEWQYKRKIAQWSKIGALVLLISVLVTKIGLIWLAGSIRSQVMELSLSEGQVKASESTEADLQRLISIEKTANIGNVVGLSRHLFGITECAPLGLKLNSVSVNPLMKNRRVNSGSGTPIYSANEVTIIGETHEISTVNEYLEELGYLNFIERVDIVKLKQAEGGSKDAEFELLIETKGT